mmetsp:Transcript_17054/g.24748  ORF Transcript_17054/g.24748 Transcript_17054/m.24748 type:complete len:361 (+) Transcript_17054:112-1194(+)
MTDAALLPPDTIVKITGVTARPELNNELGKILSYNSDRQRYMVAINSLTGSSAMLFKPENVQKATFVDSYKYKALELKNAAMMLYNDPHTKEQLRRAYTSVAVRLPPPVKPEHVAGGLCFIILLSIFMIGFTKTMLLGSIMILIPTVSLQDIAAGKSYKEVATNFPNRWKENLSSVAGGRPVSDNMNYASLAIFAFLVGNVLLSSSARPTAAASIPPSPPYAETIIPPKPSAAAAIDMEQSLQQYYKLGFQDATDGKDFGTSLPSDLPSSFNTVPIPTDPPLMDDIDYSYTPPPPPSKKSRFNFGSIMALMTLARTARELAQRPDGTYSMDLLVANAKNMEHWKMGLLGICAYRVLSILF